MNTETEWQTYKKRKHSDESTSIINQRQEFLNIGDLIEEINFGLDIKYLTSNEIRCLESKLGPNWRDYFDDEKLKEYYLK